MKGNVSLNNAVRSKMEEIVSSLLDSGSVFENCKVKKIQFIRFHEGKFLWKVLLSAPVHESEFLFVKAIPPNRRNIPEINLYKNNPVSLQNFFPPIYHFSKKNGFYWVVMEELKPIPEPELRMKDFESLIKLIAEMHAVNYSKNNVLQDKQLKWIPNFRREWNKRTNKIWLTLQLRKYMCNPKTLEVVAEDYSFLKKLIIIFPSKSRPLLIFPHTVTHGCLTVHHFMESCQNSQLKLIDWATVNFAPFTIDLVDLIERGIREYAKEKKQIESFREECLFLYCEYLNKQGYSVAQNDIRGWYETTLLFKTAGEIIWKELKKVNTDEHSKYYWYREELRKLISN